MLRRLSLLAVTASLLLAAPAAHSDVLIKLGTIAPEGSTWHKALLEMGTKWTEASGGKVKVKIFAGGIAGDEGGMVTKMRIGQLQGGAISAIGLHDITPEPQALAVPALIRSYDELDFVMGKVGPDLEKALAAKGFQVLTWSDAGFVYFFSKKPAASPAEMGPQKLFCWSGDPTAEKAWRAAGFNPVVISSTEMVPSLQSGLISAFSTSSILSLSIGWYKYAGNMTDFSWGLLPGAVVVEKKSWDKIPADLQPKLLEIAHQVGDGLRATLRKQAEESKAVMKKGGLNIVEVTPAQKAQWIAAAEKSYPVLRGTSVPAETFDAVKKAAEEYRAQHT
jgi:TRAP-type C4-dicarboxylate transport system substrate-binding protein